jgi:Flp pilus assembly CpaF family ATPase
MNDLLKATMRLRPDRIIVGEVRGPEALTLLKAWNTGHPGGVATVHANSAQGGLTRLEQLIQEAIPTTQKALIAEAVNIIVFIERHKHSRRVKEIVEVTGFKNNEYMLHVY